MSSPNNIIRSHLDDILADYKSHQVREEYQSMAVTGQWSFVDGYMTWFYSVPNCVMTLDALGCPPIPAHAEILENKHARDDHAINVLPICQSIMQIKYEGIKFTPKIVTGASLDQCFAKMGMVT